MDVNVAYLGFGLLASRCKWCVSLSIASSERARPRYCHPCHWTKSTPAARMSSPLVKGGNLLGAIPTLFRNWENLEVRSADSTSLRLLSKTVLARP